MDSNHPPKAGQPQPNEVLSRHSLSALLGAQGLRMRDPDKSTADHTPSKNKESTTIQENKKSICLRLGTWNVSTLTPGLSDNPQAIGDARKTAVVSSELSKLNIDIAALQETRIPESGSLREKDYTFFWQ